MHSLRYQQILTLPIVLFAELPGKKSKINMVTTIETSVAIQKTLLDQAESVAQQLNISRSHLFEIAVENFIKTYQNEVDAEQIDLHKQASPAYQAAKTATQIGGGRREVYQGELYWLQLAAPGGSEPGYPHPHVVIQDDAINGSRINTVIVCALTSNIKRAAEPGNLLLEAGEANLSRQSVIVVSQIGMVDKTQLGEYIGSLSKQRIKQILAGMRFQQLSFFARDQAR